MKRCFGFLVCCALLIGVLPLGVFTTATNASIVKSGYCGESVTYTLDSNGLLTISGTGQMDDGYGKYSEFYLEDRIREIVIEQGVTSIGADVFRDCTGLTSITIPDSVISIGSSAFLGCTGLTIINIPDSVINIDAFTFLGCTGVERIAVSEDNPKYHSSGNCLIETETKTLIIGCKNSVIPDDGSVTTIQNGAFDDCVGLTSISIPVSVTEIGEQAFSGCSGLEKIEVAEGNPVFHSYGNCLIETRYERDDLLFGCKNSILPDDGSLIGIRSEAFYGCIDLKSITIPASVQFIQFGAFNGCSGLEKIEVSEGNPKYHSSGNCLIETKTKELKLGCNNSVIPDDDSVASITSGAFYGGIIGPTSMTIPASVTNIGNGAFSNCSGLEVIEVSEGNQKYHSSGNCIIETETKTLISGCNNSVIPDDGSVTDIADGAFRGCTGLTSITIPGSVTDIADGVFAACTGLTSLYISEGVKNIGRSAFQGCSGLKSLYIHKSVENIYDTSFLHCSNLEKIEVSSENPYFYSSGNCLIKRKSGILILGCKNSVIPDHGIGDIGPYSFSFCTGLTSITIPNTVRSIWSNAFHGCTGLTQVIIQEGLHTEIEEEAFIGCTRLERIIIPQSVTRINGSAAVPNHTLIIGVAGSYAEQWAKENNRMFREISENDVITEDVIPGDVDGNGEVLADDARLALRASAKLEELTDVQKIAADVDGDGQVLADDARQILRFSAKLQSDFEKK